VEACQTKGGCAALPGRCLPAGMTWRGTCTHALQWHLPSRTKTCPQIPLDITLNNTPCAVVGAMGGPCGRRGFCQAGLKCCYTVHYLGGDTDPKVSTVPVEGWGTSRQVGGLGGDPTLSDQAAFSRLAITGVQLERLMWGRGMVARVAVHHAWERNAPDLITAGTLLTPCRCSCRPARPPTAAPQGPAPAATAATAATTPGARKTGCNCNVLVLPSRCEHECRPAAGCLKPHPTQLAIPRVHSLSHISPSPALILWRQHLLFSFVLSFPLVNVYCSHLNAAGALLPVLETRWQMSNAAWAFC